MTARLRAPGSIEAFLEVGCAFGQVIRQLIHDGVPSERLYGTDLQAGFLDMGYDLFRDRDPSKSKATFIAGDMLKDDDVELDQLTGKIDVIYAQYFFHLFEREDQLKAAKRMVRFLNPRNPNVLIFGRNGGPKVDGWEKYVLDAQAWREMWHEVGEATGMSLWAEMDMESGEDWIKVRFSVCRM